MSEQGKLPPTPSPRQLAKQKHEIVNLAIKNGVFDKYFLLLHYLDLNFDDVNAITYVSRKKSHNEIICKIVKYECACMESNYADCPFNARGLTTHILSTLCDIYDIYVKEKNESCIKRQGRIFACVLCKDVITYNGEFFKGECFAHMAGHFSSKNIHPTMYADFKAPYNIFKKCFLVELGNAKEEEHKSLQCMVCNNIFISHNEYYILSHIQACSLKFINESPKICREDEFKDFVPQNLFFLKVEVSAIELYTRSVVMV